MTKHDKQVLNDLSAVFILTKLMDECKKNHLDSEVNALQMGIDAIKQNRIDTERKNNTSYSGT